MATPKVASNGSRVLNKIFAILFDPSSDRDATSDVGGANVNKAKTRVWLSAGVPSGGTNVENGDWCLDTSNDDVYRYSTLNANAWYKINVTS